MQRLIKVAEQLGLRGFAAGHYLDFIEPVLARITGDALSAANSQVDAEVFAQWLLDEYAKRGGTIKESA